MRIIFRPTRKSLLIAALSAFITGCTAFIVLSFFFLGNRPLTANITSPLPQISLPVPLLSPANEQPSSEIKNLGILLLGYGGAGHGGGYLTDAIQVLNIDLEMKKITLISIPRDLWVKPENGKETKINTVFASDNKQNLKTSGAAKVKAVVSDITGLPLSYFISVDFVGFMRAIGIELKGIEVQVSQTLDDPWYPISGEEVNTCGKTAEEVTALTAKYSGFELEKQFPCRYEHLHFEKGVSRMEGGTALKYVRSRHGSSEGDISRGKRQQEVLIGIVKKLISLDVLNNLPNLYQKLTKHVQSDINLEIAKSLAPLILNSASFKTVNINLAPANVLATATTSDKQAIIIPKEGNLKWNQVREYIKSEAEKN